MAPIPFMVILYFSSILLYRDLVSSLKLLSFSCNFSNDIIHASSCISITQEGGYIKSINTNFSSKNPTKLNNF